MSWGGTVPLPLTPCAPGAALLLLLGPLTGLDFPFHQRFRELWLLLGGSGSSSGEGRERETFPLWWL